MVHPVLRFSEKITAFPVLHGSGDFALEVRRLMLQEPFDCVALPLPPSFQACVEEAVTYLPAITAVVQRSTAWSPEQETGREEGLISYVPVDPCQPVIMALRVALQERIPRAFIDLETDSFVPYAAAFPDPYALKRVRPEKFAAALLAAIPPPPESQVQERIAAMAARLKQLQNHFNSILFICPFLLWPYIRRAFRKAETEVPPEDLTESPAILQVKAETLYFFLGELPFVTGLYEQARRRLTDDENLTVDGIKELLIETRARYTKQNKHLARDLSPQTLSIYLKYVRNLSLINNRLTPDLYTLVVAAKQIAGDGFALELVETARSYPYQRDLGLPEIVMGIEKARLPSGEIVKAVSRLPGPPVTWGKVELKPRPPEIDQHKWRLRWDPFNQCSHLPEDEAIERFRTHVFDCARTIIGLDLARSEKFTTSLKDGIDVRETLRHFYSGDIYVKVNPPTRGDLDSLVILFDTPAHPRDYPWRTTWYAEHEEESTIAFYATNYLDEIVGPGIARAKYGGAMFLYPPVAIPDVWRDPRLDFTDTLEERLLAAACLHSRHPRIALLSPVPPRASWRRLARSFAKKWIYIPLSRFNASLLRQLRIVHVLNGWHVRSYADFYIRKA